MKKAIFFFLLFTNLFAQNREPFKDKKFKILVTTIWIATIYDDEMTLLVQKKYPYPITKELNPFLHPIIDSKSPTWKKRIGIYSFNFIVNNILIGISGKLYNEKRNSWFIPMLTIAVTHSLAGSLNLRIIL